MQSTPIPPHLGKILLKAFLLSGIGLVAVYVGLFAMKSFPYLVYLALYHTDHLLPFVTNYFQWVFSNFTNFLFGGFIIVMGIWRGISGYRAKRQQWQMSQEYMLDSKNRTTAEQGDSIPLPSPTSLPLMQVVIEERRSLSRVLITEAIWIWSMSLVYVGWAQVLFRWPPNQNLDYSIIGSVVGIFLIGTIITFWAGQPRRIVVDHVGITVHHRKQEHMIFWPDVRQIVLLPTNMNKTQVIPAENYQLLTSAKPFDLQAPRGNSTSASQKRQAIREAIALAMYETRLPLVVDNEDLQKRNIALDAEESSGQRAVKYSIFLLSALFCLGFAGGIGLSLHPNPAYHSVAGQLAHYSLATEEAKIQISGDNTTYFLSTNGVSPYPPQRLPNGISIMMRVSGTDVGVLDVNNATIQWHIVTQTYAEPWSIWIELGVWESLFLITGVGLLFAGMRGFWRLVRSHHDQTTNSDIFPPRELPSFEPDALSWSLATAMTKQQLRQYARLQGKWWGVEPKEVRELAVCCIGLSFALGLLAGILPFLTLQSPILPNALESIALNITLWLITLGLLIVSVQLIRKWRFLRTKDRQTSAEIAGTVLVWSSYVSLLGARLDTLIQIRTTDGHDYFFRVHPQYVDLVRHNGAKIRVTFIPETAYVTSVVRAVKVESIVVNG